MSNAQYTDSDVKVLAWPDGCVNAFFAHDTTAIETFIAEKRRIARDNTLSYNTRIIKKSEYDRTMGYNTNI